jgi:hypothetical protein
MKNPKNTAVANAAEVWFPCDKSRMSAAELCPPGTEFLDAETGHPKSPPETTCVRRDQKELKPGAQIPAQTAYLNSTGNYPGSGGLAGGHDRDRTCDPYHVKVARDTNSRVKSKRKGR